MRKTFTYFYGKNLQYLLSLKRKGVQKSEYNMLLAYYVFFKKKRG